jgi:hypothetical protein
MHKTLVKFDITGKVCVFNIIFLQMCLMGDAMHSQP